MTLLLLKRHPTIVSSALNYGIFKNELDNLAGLVIEGISRSIKYYR